MDPNVASDSKMYKGVRKRKWGKWVSEIRLPNSRERIWLGSYDTQEKAARAFDAALYCLRGKCASFNFPDTPINLEANNNNVVLNSLSHQEIQEVAAKFANDSNQAEEREKEKEPLNGSNSFFPTEVWSNSNEVSPSRFESQLKVQMSPTVFEHEKSKKSFMHDYGGAMEVDHDGDMRSIDWTFLNVLDHDTNYNNVGVNGYDYFGLELDKMNSGEFLYNPSAPTFFEDDNNNGEEIEGGDTFSNHSFLWSWSY